MPKKGKTFAIFKRKVYAVIAKRSKIPRKHWQRGRHCEIFI